MRSERMFQLGARLQTLLQTVENRDGYAMTSLCELSYNSRMAVLLLPAGHYYAMGGGYVAAFVFKMRRPRSLPPPNASQHHYAQMLQQWSNKGGRRLDEQMGVLYTEPGAVHVYAFARHKATHTRICVNA